jgi:amino acid transporter
MSTHHKKLGQFFATAISGNDILSSSLYVSGIAILFAGVYAPLVLLCIAGVLYLYKTVYTEVVEALPVNGGAYNCLLNGTQKIVAGIAGITTFLSYVATAVISAKVALEYLHTLIPVPVMAGTILLLFFFALLVIAGIRDSAKVASAIFVIHIITLVSFLIFGYLTISHGLNNFADNMLHTTEIIQGKGGIIAAFFLAFSASLLGVSGFESSANFVEEQETGVFRKTLRNMLTGVAIFNPLIALIVLVVMPYASIIAAKDFVLSDAAFAIGGTFFRSIIVVDAFLVLAGAVLTSYVGVSGLISRMAADGCLPTFFGKRNKRGSYNRIILTFFLLCTSILISTKGNLLSLAGVYTIAFLGVMSSFAFGNLVLKATRHELKRTYKAPILFVILAGSATVAGIVGNVMIDANNLLYFIYYFIPPALLVAFIVYQDYILRFLLKITPKNSFIHEYLQNHFADITDGKFVVFINHIDRLYQILRYVNRNETGRNIFLVHCTEERKNRNGHSESCEEIKNAVQYLQKAGVLSHLQTTFICKHEPFGPHTIKEVSKELKIHENRILIGSIHDFHPFEYADLHGVRIIF